MEHCYDTNGLYRDVDVSMKVRFKEYNKDLGSSISISTGKQNVYEGRSGLTYAIYGNGFVSLKSETEQVNGWKTYISGVDNWFEMRMRVVGNTVTISVDGVELYNGPAKDIESGYIALQADFANVEIDDFAVIPLL